MKFIFILMFVSFFASTVNATPFSFLVGDLQSLFYFPSCTERGGIKLTEPFDGHYCAVLLRWHGL